MADKVKKAKIESDEKSAIASPVIGYFEGKSGDGTITNENGLDIGTDVWRNVFESEEFKENLANGFYIGFLGHPEDPGCQDFKNGCIILREAHVDDDGEVFSKCDLIDTPVGRIVKTFIDAGVHFGLSVRGAGTINGSSVDPDDFVFRGFDVVAFPAYKDAIPEFTEIAASSNVADQKKYKKICACVEQELPNIDDVTTLKNMQCEFGENSDVYQDIQNKIDDIECVPQESECSECQMDPECKIDILKQKVDAMMNLYLQSLNTIQDLTNQLNTFKEMLEEKERKLCASKSVYKDQISVMSSKYNDLKSEKNSIQKRYKDVINANQRLKKDNRKLRSSIQASKDIESKNLELEKENKKIIASNEQIKKTLDKVKNNNLNYKCKIDESENQLSEKDSMIASLQTKIDKTVTSQKDVEAELSNRDKENKELKSDVKAALDLVADYQNSYAELYASILGVPIDGIVVDTMTSVSELKQKISSSTSTSNIAVAPQYIGEDDITADDFDDDYDEYEDEYNEDVIDEYEEE